MATHILTITLNPAVDKSTIIDSLKPDKKLRCEKPVYEPGGGGINVSRGLARLGIRSTAFFTSGGAAGKRLEALLEDEGVNGLPFAVKNDTRENFMVVATNGNDQYRFGMPGSEIDKAEIDAMLKAIDGCSPEIAVISGSLPPGMENVDMRRIIKNLKGKGAKVIIDTSGEALEESLKEGVYLVKPNLGELAKLTGIDDLDNDSADEAARQLIDKGGADVVVVSMGPQGAYMVTKNKKYHINAPQVKKRTTVGAGDSVVAGIVAMLANGEDELAMARMGVACGSAATMSTGTGLFKKDDAEKLYRWLSK